MSRKTVQIELSPGRLTVRSARAERMVEIEDGAWEQAWADGLRPLDRPLRQALDELQIGPADAALLYRSPTMVAEVFSYPVKPAAASEAAMMALADALGRPLEDASWSLRTLAATARPRAQTVILACGDHNETAELLCDWLARADLRLIEAEPADARALAEVAAIVRSGARAEGCRAALRLDPGGGVFAASEAGHIAFVRSISIGADHFVEALTRPIRRAAGALQLSRAQARDIWARFGVPEPQQIVDEALGLRGADLLPLVQPVLQRLIVDVKQSIRFGLQDASRSSVQVEMIGPAAATPGLSEALAAAIDRPVAPCAIARTGAAARPMSALAPSAREGILFRRAALALRLGALLAFAQLGYEGYARHAEKRDLDAQIAAIETDAENAQALLALAEERMELAAALEAAEAQLELAFGNRIDWLAAMREIAAVTPEEIRFTEIAAVYESGVPIASLHGVAWLTDESEDVAESPIMRCLEALRASPLVERVELGEAQRAEIEGRASRRFSLRAALVGSPAWDFSSPAEVEP